MVFMIDDTLANSQTETLRALYNASSPAAKMLDNFANRRRDRKITEVDRLGEVFPDLARADIIDVLKKLDECGFGRFVVGRRGAASRFEWSVPLRSVGRAASGQGTVETEFGKPDEDDPAPHVIRHDYRLRPDFTAQVSLPEDLTAREAERLADFVRTLPFGG
jgi:hypothetical protein